MASVIALARAHWPIPAALVLGVLLGWILFHPRQPAVHEKASEHVQQTAAAHLDQDKVVDTQKDAGPTRKTVIEFDPRCPPVVPVRLVPGAPPPAGILRETVIETGPTQVITRAATETHADEQQATTVDRKLDLTITPPSLPRWAVQVGFEDVLHARTLRLAGRMRVVGPFWAELAVAPASHGIGTALAVEW